MSRIKDFFLGLSKSTKITLISCGCFVLLTMLLLLVFVLFPITPSEKVIASFGRENLVYQAQEEEAAHTTAVTTAPVQTTVTTAAVTTAVEQYTIVTFTTMDGYLPGVILQTGTPGQGNHQTITEPVTQPITEQPPTEEASQESTQEATEVPTSAVEIVTTPAATEPPTQETPQATEPPAEVTPTSPPQTDIPVVVPPVVVEPDPTESVQE